MALHGHDFQAFGHVGFIDPVQMNRCTRLLEYPVGHAAQIRPWRIAQIGQGPGGRSRQTKHRVAIGLRFDVRGNRLRPEHHHVVTLSIQLQGLRGVVVDDQQVTPPFGQAHGRIVHIEGDQTAFDGPKALAQAGHPGREKRESQGVRDGKFDEVLPRRVVAAQHGPGVLQGLKQLQRLVKQGLTGRGEFGGVGAAVHQVGTRPGLQGLDAPGERRLRHVPQLRRAAETAGFSQAHKVFKPLGFHAELCRGRDGGHCWR